MAWLPNGENISKISLFVLTQLTNVTDGQTDRQTHTHTDTAWWHIPRLCIALRGKKIDKTGSADRASCSGCPRSARTHENIQTVEELVCSQEGQPETSKSPTEIARETGMSHSSVRRIVKKDLNLKTFRRREVQLLSDVDKKTRLRACQRLKVRTTADKTAQTWLSDEKLFTVQTPTNTQNDRTYAAVSNKRDVPPERLLKGRKHFSQSVVVSVALSKHGETSLVFVERGAKVTTVTIRARWQRRATWHSSTVGKPFHLSTRWCTSTSVEADSCLPNRERAGVHRAWELATEQPRPVIRRRHDDDDDDDDLNPVDYCIWGALHQLVYRQKIQDLDHLKEVLSCWEQINQELRDKAIDQWLDRFSLAFRAKGEHIEQHLNWDCLVTCLKNIPDCKT